METIRRQALARSVFFPEIELRFLYTGMEKGPQVADGGDLEFFPNDDDDIRADSASTSCNRVITALQYMLVSGVPPPL